MASGDPLDLDLTRALPADRPRFRKRLREIRRAIGQGRPQDRNLARLAEDLARSAALLAQRRAGVPAVRYEADLPILAKRDEIAAALGAHQVLIVCGETGSGKSTQLPKICLELGRGVERLIGHTQPRRIAARSVAARIAEELAVPLGREVGYKIRFTDSTGPRTYIKLMTDGILLAETRGDPVLARYDTIILDEAHERSLNIDFLIGYLKRLLPRRPVLKLIVTSATIDAQRFAAHFATAEAPAPVIEVSGRSYPVEIRYRPPAPDENGDEPDLQDAVAAAVDELAALGEGDLLVFMPTERDILESSRTLRGRRLPGGPAEILPLYARLPAKQQQRVFQPHPTRRIIIATNVAESSLTVPGIRYVVDPGAARISRYSTRSKTQRLPIEPISRASADQRAGRCGRIAPGVCVRLFSEESYLGRERFTPPEIQRTNLAAVILQTKALRLGDVEGFPFLDPPRADAVRDGYRTLFELGALDDRGELTDVGRRLATLPVDPRIGRIILAAEREDCLAETLVIAAALEVQDPRDRPLEQQEAADAAHARFADRESDFLSYLKLWDFYQGLKAGLSRGQLRKACRQNYLSYNRIREWGDVHLELLELVRQAGMTPKPRADRYEPIHRAIVTGLLANVARRTGTHEYTAAGGGKFFLWPGSCTFAAQPKWIVAAEMVETTRRYLRCCARVNPRWIESLAGHLATREYGQPFWDRGQRSAVAPETVSLMSLPIVSGRRVRLGPLDPQKARELLIQRGLVEGDIDLDAEFLAHNRRLLEETEQLQIRMRRHDLLLGQWARFDFYDRQLPETVCDGDSLTGWLRAAQHQDRRVLWMSREDLVREDLPPQAPEAFPETLEMEGKALPLAYQFEPGTPEDGVTLTVPVEALAGLDADRVGWLVPGLIYEKIVALIRTLPKAIRRKLVPAPEKAKAILERLRFGEGNLLAGVAAAAAQLAGEAVRVEDFQLDKLPGPLAMNLRVVDPQGQTLGFGKDLEALRRQLRAETATRLAALDVPPWNRAGLTDWDFGELPESVRVVHRGVQLTAYPALVDAGQSAALRLAASAEAAVRQSRLGLRRLCWLAAAPALDTQVEWLPNLQQMLLATASIPGLDLKRQLAELVADRAFVADWPLPRTRAEFDRRLEEGRGRLGLAVQETLEIVQPLVESYRQVRLALESPLKPRWQYAVDDIRSQLSALLAPDFLAATPWAWLQHYPRYLRAIVARLDALAGGALPRDERYTAQFQERWRAYARRAAGQQAAGLDDPALEHYRWMLEEYRVSLFAQKLGTAIPVSVKRLDQQWSQVADVGE